MKQGKALHVIFHLLYTFLTDTPLKHDFKKWWYKDVDSKIKERTGFDLMELAIKNDYREIIRIILFDLKEPFGFDTLSKVFQKGSPTVIKMFLNRLKNGKIDVEKDLKRSQIDIEEIEKSLQRLRRKDWNSDTTSRKELIELLSAKEMSKWSFQEKQKHPVYSLQIGDIYVSNC